MFGAGFALVEPIGVDQSDRLRELGGTFMMVDHDHLDPGAMRHVKRFKGHRAAIDGNHQIAALLAEPDQRLSRGAIALHQPVRNIIASLQSEIAEQADQQGGTGCAVDIIVAEYRNLFLVADRLAQAFRCRFHVAEDGRIGHETPNRRVAVNRQCLATGTAGEQQLGDQVIGLEPRIACIGAGTAPAPALAGQGIFDIQYCIHGPRYAGIRRR